MKQADLSKQLLGKQVVFRFNGDPKNDETITDRHGAMLPWRVGDVFKKAGKQWRVEVVRNDLNMDRSKTVIPIQRVYLTDRAC
jgi:hypothetical protein